MSQLGEGPDPQEKAIWGGHLPSRRTDDGRAKDAEPLKWVEVHRGNGCVRVCYWEHWQCRLRVICEEQSEDATPSPRRRGCRCVWVCSVDCLFFDICARFRCIALQVSYTSPQTSYFHFLRNSLPTRNESGICRVRVQQNWKRIRTRVNKVNLIPPAPSWNTLQAYSGDAGHAAEEFPPHFRHSRLRLGSRVDSVLDSGAGGPGFKSQSRRYRVTVLGKLLTPIVPLFTKQQNW